jgi:hypothetical protein
MKLRASNKVNENDNVASREQTKCARDAWSRSGEESNGSIKRQHRRRRRDNIKRRRRDGLQINEERRALG